jgi:peptide/nickel transport system permease protein
MNAQAAGGPTATPVPALHDETSEAYFASQWQLMWWRFRKHRMAVICTVVILLLYLVGIFAEFVAPADPEKTSTLHKYVPAQSITFVDSAGSFSWRPGVNALVGKRDPETQRMRYVPDTSKWYPIHFFAQGDTYKLWGLIESDLHLAGLGPEAQGQAFYLIGSDRLGRDMLSRIVHGTRVSLSIGLIGVGLSLLFGIILGGISGFYGGIADTVIQRVIEFIRSMPTIPLWMALAAALPPQWPPQYVYFGITVILSLIGWTGMARVVRGRFLSLREEDFVMAARFCGSSEMRIILRHMVPSFLSHIIAAVTLAIPSMIISETSLSFLGLGLRPPVISWGVLLQEAQNVQTVALSPWLLLPALAVVVAVLAFNFMGDGLRDAADPYGR